MTDRGFGFCFVKFVLIGCDIWWTSESGRVLSRDIIADGPFCEGVRTARICRGALVLLLERDLYCW